MAPPCQQLQTGMPSQATIIISGHCSCANSWQPTGSSCGSIQACTWGPSWLHAASSVPPPGMGLLKWCMQLTGGVFHGLCPRRCVQQHS